MVCKRGLTWFVSSRLSQGVDVVCKQLVAESRLSQCAEANDREMMYGRNSRLRKGRLPQCEG